MILYKLIVLFLLFNLSLAKQIVYDWTLAYKTVNPDGLRERRVISINDQWPPLPIKLNVNDTLVLNVHNKLNEPTAIHSHGIFQNNGTNLHDGASMVTQCPIPKNYDFTYEFPVTQPGTFWIHSHFKVQYMDGLRVPLIVYDPNESIQYDEDEIITVSDWYHEDSYTNLEQYMNRENLDGVEPIPQSGLINDHKDTSLVFKPGKTYRLRLINMSGIAVFNIALDGHDMEIIEVDGILTQPTTVKNVYLGAGQRMSVLVKTKQSTALNYRLHANMDPEMFDYIPDDLNLNIEAPIYYNKESADFAPRDPFIKSDYDDAFIPPLVHTPPLTVDRELDMTVDFTENTDGLNHGMINDIPYIPPYVPTLHTVMTIGDDYTRNIKVYGPQTNVYILDLDQVVQLVIQNLDDGPHPFHLHGHVFQVIDKGSGEYNASNMRVPPSPTIRDTVTVPAEGYLVIRFKANNPGVWFFHCHVDWHIPAGLASTFITAPELVDKQLPEQFKQLCKAMGFPATGNAAGKQGDDVEGAPGGIGPVKNTFMMGAIVATLVGLSTIIWHVWIDPGQPEEDKQPLLEEEDKEPLLQEDKE